MRPIRVLHVVGSLNRGGIETWLMSVLRQADRRRFQIDFVVSNRSQSPLEKEIQDLGSRIHVCMAHSQPIPYAFRLARLLREQPYDIVHSHLHHLNGVVSLIASVSRVPVRIVHSHFAISGTEAEAAGFDRPRYRFARLLMRSSATGELGCSAPAGRALFGANWDRSSNNRVLFCGIDLKPFRFSPERRSIRSAFDIPSDAHVIGHAGRFVAQKNHTFFIDVAREYARIDSSAHFLLAGNGPLWNELKNRAASLPESDRFHFVGARDDVPNLMAGAMDCFLFPSHFEGLPLVLVEAQAAGLPCILSDVVASETFVCQNLIRKMSLKQSPREWAEAISLAIGTSTPDSRIEAFRLLESSPFDIRCAWRALEKYYFELLSKCEDSPEFLEETASV
jgi:glycosyltransferase involved in cell wall biosynthesis